MVGDLGQRYADLFAVQNIAVALPDGGRLGAHRVASGVGFGKTSLENEVPLLLVVVSSRKQGQAVQTHVHGQDDPEGRVYVLELLAGQSQRDVIHPRTAILLRDANAKNVQLGYLLQDGPIEVLFGIILLDMRSYLRPSEMARMPFLLALAPSLRWQRNSRAMRGAPS